MSKDLEKYLIVDDRLNISDKMSFGVYMGASSVNAQKFPASAQSSSQHVYNIQVPSIDTVIDRRVLWQSTITLTVSATAGAGAGQIPALYTSRGNLVAPGSFDALSPFPLHNMMNTISATINNNTVTMSAQDVIPQLLRLNNKGELQAYNGYTPTAYDQYLNYSDVVKYITNPLGGIDNSTDEDINFRGAFPVSLGPVLDNGAVAPGNVIPNQPVVGHVYSQTITFTVTEPILLSPFMFGLPNNRAGLKGVQNMSFLMNVGNLNRAWRHAVQNTGNVASDRNWNVSVTGVAFNNSQLIFNFLSPHDSMKLPSKCVTPYYTLNSYILNPLNSAPIADGTPTTITSNALNLSGIPDKLVICCRKPLAQQTCQDTDSWFTINSVNIQFNNVPGICAGWLPQHLYDVSRENGSNQSWYEFSGLANASSGQVYTSGSLLVLDVAKDVPLREAFLSAGSGGTYNIQFDLNVTHHYGGNIVPELILLTMNSGDFVIERGTSTVNLNMLTPEDVISAKQKTDPIAHQDLKRIVGMGFFDNLKTAYKKISPYLKKGIEVADAVSGSGGISASGLSASGLSASGYSGGKQRKRLADRLKA